MGNIKALYRCLPVHIKTLLIISNGWLVGGAIPNLLTSGISKLNDFDIIVPDGGDFQNGLLYLHPHIKNLTVNTYGGLKITLDDDTLIDIWVEELSHFISVAKNCEYVFNLKSQTLLKNEK